MKKILSAALLLSTFLFGLVGCDKKEDYISEPLTDYLNLEIGKFVRYRLDSTLFINFGQKDTVVKYQAKDVVEAEIMDALGRPSFRVVRYLSDTTGTKPWVPSDTYMITPTRESVEIIENNFRYLKLKLPIKEGFSWKGNSYISTQSSDKDWIFRFMDDWDYVYENLGQSFKVLNNQTVESTVTINQRDDIAGFPNDPGLYSEYTFSKEVFGKGIGLIYRDFLHWEYQPPTGGNPGYKEGYGIKLVMIDHN